MRTGGVEPPQPEATGLQPAELTFAQRPREEGRPTGFEPVPRGSRPRMLPLHHSHHDAMSGDDRTRTGGLSPDKRLLSPLSYASVLRGWDSNPRSRAHEAREDSRSSTALRNTGLAGRSRTCDLRCPKPAGWPTPLQPGTRTPGGTRTRTSELRARRHNPSTTGASKAPAAGIEPAPRD